MPSLLAERARSECARSMRAVEGNLGHLLQILGKRDRGAGNSLCLLNARTRTPLVGRAHLGGNRQAAPSARKTGGYDKWHGGSDRICTMAQ